MLTFQNCTFQELHQVFKNLIWTVYLKHILIPVLMMKIWRSQDIIWHVGITVLTKSVVVFVFILKTFIPLKESDIYLVDECITFNLALGNKICSFIALTDLLKVHYFHRELPCENPTLRKSYVQTNDKYKMDESQRTDFCHWLLHFFKI